MLNVSNKRFLRYGKSNILNGEIETVFCTDDNSLVKSTLAEDGRGKILVIDAVGVNHVSMIGDQIAAEAVKNNWQGVWQLDQFPFREDSVEMANMAIDFLKSVDKALDNLDYDALSKAQANHDAMGALKIAQKALYKHLARD